MTRALPRHAISLLLCLPLAVLAHAGHHDDDDDEAKATAAVAAPAPAAMAQVEVVAQRDHADLVIYVDDYATNAPLPELRLSVHSGAGVVQAAADGAGSYRIPADLAGAGSGPLQLEIEGVGVHLLQAVDLPPAEPAAAPAAARLPAWSAALAVAPLLLLALWLLRRRTRSAPAAHAGAT